jgi:hypothetical protein
VLHTGTERFFIDSAEQFRCDDLMQPDAQSDTPDTKKPWLRIGVCVVLLLVAAAAVFYRRGSHSPVVFLAPTTTLSQAPWPDRWIPAKWGWLWQTRDWFLGKRRPVTLDAEILKLRSASLENWGGPPPTLVTNQEHVWILDDMQMKALRTKLMEDTGTSVQSRPRFMTSDGISARMMSGSSVLLAGGATGHLGLILEVLPKVRKRRTDLFVSVQVTGIAKNDPANTLRTNVMAVLRAQIQPGQNLFLLESAADQPATAMLMSVKLP